MAVVTELDVPSPIDWHDPPHAREWEWSAQARPGRSQIFDAFGGELSRLGEGEEACIW